MDRNTYNYKYSFLNILIRYILMLKLNKITLRLVRIEFIIKIDNIRIYKYKDKF